MTFFEKITDSRDLVQWKGHEEANYLYTSGKAGEDFFRGLMDGKFLANKCPECGKVYFPPRLYCEDCFVEIGDDHKELDGRGVVDCYTVARINTYEEKLEEPEVWAIIKMDGADSGLLHKVDVEPEKIEPKLKVRAVLKPKKEREGTINDIKCFEPL